MMWKKVLYSMPLALVSRAVYHPVHLAAVLIPQCAGGWTALDISASYCSDFEALPVPMTEDVNLYIDAVDIVRCQLETTVAVSGPFELRLTLNSNKPSSLRFTNIRFVVQDGATLRVDVDNNEEMATEEERNSSLLIFDGIARSVSNGGVLQVNHGATATFSLPVSFEDNSVAMGYSGGAIHVDGTVTFEHVAQFEGNLAGGEGGSCGGAASVGKGGRVVFSEFSIFLDNSSERGGALCNRGSISFFRRSFFTGNTASADDPEGVAIEGDGGAVYTEHGSEMVFRRKSTMLNNFANASGGAVYNSGRCIFETSAAFQGNRAKGISRHSDEGEARQQDIGGGHVFNRGDLAIRGDSIFREGSTGANGGAVYTLSGESTVLGGIATLEDNSAVRVYGLCEIPRNILFEHCVHSSFVLAGRDHEDGQCDNIFSHVTGREVRLMTTSPTHTRVVEDTADVVNKSVKRRRRMTPEARTTPCQP